MKIWCICLLVVSWLGFSNAWAAERSSANVLDKRLTVYGGAQIYQSEGEFSSTQEGRPVIEINLDNLNLDKNTLTPVAGATLKFGRLSLFLDYYGYHEEGARSAGFNFDFGDLNVPIGARIDSNLDLDIYVANLSFDLIHSEKARFGLGVGAHVADLDLAISATASVAGRELPLGEGNEDFTAPLPNLYASGAYAFTDKFVFRYGGGWMDLSYGDYDGSLVFADAFLEYWPFRHAGLGAGYRYVKIDVEYDPGTRIEKYDVKLPGPVFYVTFGF
jgi:hypothetical protein